MLIFLSESAQSNQFEDQLVVSRHISFVVLLKIKVMVQIPSNFLQELNRLVKRNRGEVPIVDEGSDECIMLMERFDSGWSSIPPNSMEDEFLTGVRIGALQ